MAEEDGYSLMRSLRDAGIVTPAIALTAYARLEDADEARAAGFQVHLAKPVDATRLDRRGRRIARRTERSLIGRGSVRLTSGSDLAISAPGRGAVVAFGAICH